MTPANTLQASVSVLTEVANPAARALALGCAAGLGLTAFRVKSTSVRLFTWTTVLYAAVAMPLLGWILPSMSVPTPAFLQFAASSLPFSSQEVSKVAESSQSPATVIGASAEDGATDRNKTQRTKATKTPSQFSPTVSLRASHADQVKDSPVVAVVPETSPSFISQFSWSSIRWDMIAAGIYFAVASLLLARFFVGLAFSRKLMRSSQQIQEPRLTLRLASRACASSLAAIPQAAESELISVPVTMGAFRPAILLPTDWREWDDAKLDAVIAHEVSHVARRDALTQRLALLHRAIFWFSPLAWWLDRHLADLAEQASDEAALSCGADRTTYARTLLEFFETLHTTPGRVWWQGVSMAKAGQAEKRLERILSSKGTVAMGVKKSIAVVVVALAVPVIYLAASVHASASAADSQYLHFAQRQDQTPPSAQAASAPAARTNVASAPPANIPSEMTPPEAGSEPEAALAPVAPSSLSMVPLRLAPVAAAAPRIAARAYAPMAALAPRAQMPPLAWVGQSASANASGSGSSYSYEYDDEERFVIASGKSDSLTMSGSSADARHVEKLRKSISGDFIWFQRDEKSYIIRDQATIDRAKKFWAPQDELGKKQEELGKQQEALGKQQEELGHKMEQIHVNVPDMTAELDKLKAKLKQLSAGATIEQVGEIQSEIGELQSKIGDIESQAGDQQSKIGDEMGALGEKQGKLGEEQGKLGERQGELAKEASRQMKQLLDEAITKGTAQPEL